MALAQDLSERFRRSRDKNLRRLIAACPRQGERLRILDLGGRAAYWRRVGFDFLAEQCAEITLLNLSEAEIGADDGAPAGLIVHAVGDACALNYPDGHFDLVHSNSVIEHVGLWPAMAGFARESRRVARALYHQTPNFWFPVDPHFWRMPFIHWLPRPTRAFLLRILPLATAGRARDVATAYGHADSSILLTRSQLRALFPDCRIGAERLLLMPKSLIVIREADRPVTSQA